MSELKATPGELPGRINGMRVVVSRYLDLPEWWVRPYWWLDEDFRNGVNDSLFQAFGHRVKPPPFYTANQSAMRIPSLRGLSEPIAPDMVITNEIGLWALAKARGET